MNWFGIYKNTGKSLVSIASGAGAEPQGWKNPVGKSFVSVGETRPDPSLWNPGTLAFDGPGLPKLRRQVLADKATWTQADRDEAIKILLDPKKGA